MRYLDNTVSATFSFLSNGEDLNCDFYGLKMFTQNYHTVLVWLFSVYCSHSRRTQKILSCTAQNVPSILMHDFLKALSGAHCRARQKTPCLDFSTDSCIILTEKSRKCHTPYLQDPGMIKLNTYIQISCLGSLQKDFPVSYFQKQQWFCWKLDMKSWLKLQNVKFERGFGKERNRGHRAFSGSVWFRT